MNNSHTYTNTLMHTLTFLLFLISSSYLQRMPNMRNLLRQFHCQRCSWKTRCWPLWHWSEKRRWWYCSATKQCWLNHHLCWWRWEWSFWDSNQSLSKRDLHPCLAYTPPSVCHCPLAESWAHLCTHSTVQNSMNVAKYVHNIHVYIMKISRPCPWPTRYACMSICEYKLVKVWIRSGLLSFLCYFCFVSLLLFDLTFC